MARNSKKTNKSRKAQRGRRQKERNFLASFDPTVKRWLNTPDPDDYDEDGEEDDHYDRWLLKRMSKDQLVDVGGVLVDRALFTARFKCVPELCSPAVDRGHYRSCCADLTVFLTGAERNRMARYRGELVEHLDRREPRLHKLMRKRKGRIPRFFLDEDGDAFARPGNRCVFSKIDSQGRIRCHLHTMYRKLGIGQTEIQPVTCRLFPMVLCHMSRGRVLVTIINRENYKAFGSKHPRYFPCLAEPDLPLAMDTMASTMDWVFGPGFAKAVRRAAKADAR